MGLGNLFRNIKSQRVGGAVTKSMLNPAIAIANRMGVAPSKEAILSKLHKGAFLEICDLIKKNKKLPTVDEVTGSLPKNFIDSMAALGITLDDMKKIAEDLLKDATIEKFKRYI
jgi:hypothetical protein